MSREHPAAPARATAVCGSCAKMLVLGPICGPTAESFTLRGRRGSAKPTRTKDENVASSVVPPVNVATKFYEREDIHLKMFQSKVFFLPKSNQILIHRKFTFNPFFMSLYVFCHIQNRN